MVLNNLFPVFALIGIGALLKQLNITNDAFLKASDKLVYYFFFPSLLFWKIGEASPSYQMAGNLTMASVYGVAAIYVISSICIKAFKVSDFKAGSFSQSCYRFNTYIGMAVIMNAMGEPGVRLFGILIGFVIPMINVLAVSTLIWFSGKQYDLKQRAILTTKALFSNPLIIACLSGLIYSRLVGHFPLFVANAFKLSSMATLPMALLSVGGALTFKSINSHFLHATLAAFVKLAAMPVIGILLMKGLDVPDPAFKVGAIFFALPTSPAIFVLSSQLNSDTDYASAAIVVSTMLSFISLSFVLMVY